MLDDFEIRLRVPDRRVDKERDERLVTVLVVQVREGGEFAKVSITLDSEYLVEAIAAESRGGEQLEEEVIAVTGLANKRGSQPRIELGSAGLGESVEVLVGPVGLRDFVLGGEAVADQAVEDLVEVADVEVAPLGTDSVAELSAQLVAVAFAFGEQGEDRVVDGYISGPPA